MNPEDIVDLDEGKQRINVDFDKTLTTGEGADYWTEEPMEYPDEEMIEWVNEMYARGHFITIWTGRPWSQASEVAAFLTRWDVKYAGLRCNKGGADLYVDDKAINTEELKLSETK